MGYRKLTEVELSNKSVLLRLDLNAPIDNGFVTNKERIYRSIPTITHIINKDCSLIRIRLQSLLIIWVMVGIDL